MSRLCWALGQGEVGGREGGKGPQALGVGICAREGAEGGAASGCPELRAPRLPFRRLLLAPKQSQLPWEGAFDGWFFLNHLIMMEDLILAPSLALILCGV